MRRIVGITYLLSRGIPYTTSPDVQREFLALLSLPLSALARDRSARRDFQRQQPCPSTGRRSGACPGYVADHVVPLKRGGSDQPANMQWQTVEDAKQKDRVE